MGNYAFQKDDRLHVENAWLRKELEVMQSDEYLSKLNKAPRYRGLS